MIEKFIGWVVLLGFCAGYFWYLGSQKAEALAACENMVAKYEAIYRRQPPDSHVDTPELKASWAKARGLCKEGERAHAAELVRRSASTCRFNNGCSDIPVDVTFSR